MISGASVIRIEWLIVSRETILQQGWHRDEHRPFGKVFLFFRRVYDRH